MMASVREATLGLRLAGTDVTGGVDVVAAQVDDTGGQAWRANLGALSMFALALTIVMLVWEGAEGVAAGTISGGTIFAFVVTAGIVAGAFGALTEVYGDLLRGAGAAGRLNELLNEKPSIAAPSQATRSLSGWPGVISQPQQRSVCACGRSTA